MDMFLQKIRAPFSHFAILVLLFLTTACGKGKSASTATPSQSVMVTPHEIFSTVSDTVPNETMTLAKFYKTAKVTCENAADCNPSVAALYFIDKFEVTETKWKAKWEVCTGSVVESTKNRIVIMTNRHCINDVRSDAMACPATSAAFPDQTRLTCRKILSLASPGVDRYDVAFLEFAPAPHIAPLSFVVGEALLKFESYERRGYFFEKRFGHLSQATQEAHKCKRESTTSERSLSVQTSVLCDRGTIKGFSGAPLFYRDNIVGMHSAGAHREGEDRSHKQYFVNFECVQSIRAYDSGFVWKVAPGCENAEK